MADLCQSLAYASMQGNLHTCIPHNKAAIGQILSLLNMRHQTSGGNALKKVIALCALLCFAALAAIACGSPRGSGNGSIKAKAAASVNVASVDTNFATFSTDQTRQVRAVEAATTAEMSEQVSRPTISASTATFREP